MTWTRKKDDGSSISCNFVAPADADAQVNEVLFPLSEKQTPDYAAAIEVAVTQMETFVQPAELTGNVALTADIDENVTAGAKMYLKLDADGTNRTVTPGSGFDASAPAVTVTADTVKFLTYVYDGTAFVPAV